MLPGLTAFLFSLVAACLVYYSWRRENMAWAAAIGWLLALGSLFVWSRALGAEFGVTYAIIVFVCLVWIAVTSNMEANRPDDHGDRRPLQQLSWHKLSLNRLSRPGAQACFHHGMLFMLSVPATGVIAMMLCVALVLYLPWTMPVKLAVTIFLYPVLWGAISAWICAQKNLKKPLLASVAMLAVSSLIVFL